MVHNSWASSAGRIKNTRKLFEAATASSCSTGNSYFGSRMWQVLVWAGIWNDGEGNIQVSATGAALPFFSKEVGFVWGWNSGLVKLDKTTFGVTKVIFFEAECRETWLKKKKTGMRQVLRPKSCTKNSPVPVQCSSLSFSFHSMLLQLVAGFVFFFLFFFSPCSSLSLIFGLFCFALVFLLCDLFSLLETGFCRGGWGNSPGAECAVCWKQC